MRLNDSCSHWIAFVAVVLMLAASGCTNQSLPETGAGNPAPASQYGNSGAGHRTPPAGTFTPTMGTDAGNPAGEAGQPVNAPRASKPGSPAAVTK
ncbi:MAG: hypothetical protein IT160_15960 [Bryobacterales bacterium]|nr:hypothetical protein [Bryobacterales bacterium]